MPLKTIHIVSSLDPINFGIWNAAIFALDYLKEEHDCESYVWATATSPRDPIHPAHLNVSWFPAGGDKRTIEAALSRDKLAPDNTIVISHGCWLQPTRLARQLASQGFRWIYVPHGMLEHWSMSQNFFIKNFYYNYFEKRYSKLASRVRAVSRIEQQNLAQKLGRSIDLVENGVRIPGIVTKPTDKINVLFLGRLHHKKGVFPLVKAWTAVMKDASDFRLLIAGPDQGELEKITPYINGNIEYLGAVYSDRKDSLLAASHYFALPSYSEGFPVSVLEAMSFGLVPLISEGCNFNEIFDLKLGYRIEPDDSQIATALLALKGSGFDHALAGRNRQFVDSRYSEKVIGRQLFNLYNSI